MDSWDDCQYQHMSSFEGVNFVKFAQYFSWCDRLILHKQQALLCLELGIVDHTARDYPTRFCLSPGGVFKWCWSCKQRGGFEHGSRFYINLMHPIPHLFHRHCEVSWTSNESIGTMALSQAKKELRKHIKHKLSTVSQESINRQSKTDVTTKLIFMNDFWLKDSYFYFEYSLWITRVSKGKKNQHLSFNACWRDINSRNRSQCFSPR